LPLADARPHAAVWPARLPRELVLPETTLWFNLEVSARRYPRKAAYVFFGRALSFCRAARTGAGLAGWLQAHGVRKGDRVLLFMQNCPQFVVAFYAVQRADAVVVPVNPMNRVDEFGHYITDPQARVALTTADLAPIVAEASQRLPADQRLQHIVATRLADAMPAHTGPAGEPFAPAMLDWLLADPPLPAGCTRWADALAAGASARARARQARTTWRCCPTHPAPRACPRAACTRTAR
jgi:fatty-acyl-CoA synthase